MCGIAGFLDRSLGRSQAELNRIALKMGDAISHRGPDAANSWADESQGVVLAHRRLSIIDLSPAGSQPMTSSCGRYVIAYNGEVYNVEDLRQELITAGRTSYRGHSDTEVILEGFGAWGIRATIERLIGMFACAIWDREGNQITLVRDRLGVKPLYWSIQGGRLLFGSELKALYAHPDWRGEIDKNALVGYLRHNCILAPNTAYQNVQKLQPGCILSVGAKLQSDPVIEQYWSIENVVHLGQKKPFCGTESEAVDVLEDLLGDAVKRHMVADVPLGAFLSGGVDSSVVVALMQKYADRPVKTFSIGFDEAGYNEAKHAALVAKQLGTEHTELYVSSEDALNVIPNIADMFDEPFSDSSQIPTYLLSAMTRKHVTVALSGDGGDELFAGYNRYLHVHEISKYPRWMRKTSAQLINSLSPKFWDRVFAMLPEPMRLPQAGSKMHKLASVLCEEEDDYYRKLVSHWERPEMLVPGGSEHRGLIWDPRTREIASDPVDRMRYLDACTYLPDDILVKVDRASMSVSLEARVPILDHRVVEFAWSLPISMLIKKGQGKWPLRQVLYRHVPQEIIDRPKMGFGVPIDSWLRGPLKEWAEDLLNPSALSKYDILEAAPIWQKWQEHQSGIRNWQHHLWDILMLQVWCRRYMG
ncbi:asparagine synthase (glutamine-hydrolyzing) [Alphaproteobacteria bacterium]|nr:asparagine synthase (glutamine-hydrolyzing) [Alphaproteobacteria bacterium]